MDRDQIIKKSEEIFTYLYKNNVSSDFRFPQGYGARVLETFTDEITKKESGLVNIGTIIDYCIHQVYNWRDKERWKKFTINWAFGKKAIDRYYSAKSGARYYQGLWLKENGLSREDLKYKFGSANNYSIKQFEYVSAEETTKFRLLNKEAGPYVCAALTTLYAPKSPACTQCKYSNQCANKLKELNPELYRLRITNK